MQVTKGEKACTVTCSRDHNIVQNWCQQEENYDIPDPDPEYNAWLEVQLWNDASSCTVKKFSLRNKSVIHSPLLKGRIWTNWTNNKTNIHLWLQSEGTYCWSDANVVCKQRLSINWSSIIPILIGPIFGRLLCRVKVWNLVTTQVSAALTYMQMFEYLNILWSRLKRNHAWLWRLSNNRRERKHQFNDETCMNNRKNIL